MAARSRETDAAARGGGRLWEGCVGRPAGQPPGGTASVRSGAQPESLSPRVELCHGRGEKGPPAPPTSFGTFYSTTRLLDFVIIIIYFLFGSHFILVLFSSHSSLLFCSIFFFFTHSPLSPLSGFSIPQTPHHFSRCYDKPWLINSKAGTPLRGSDYPDLQLPSSEVGSSPAAPGPVVAGEAPASVCLTLPSGSAALAGTAGW